MQLVRYTADHYKGYVADVPNHSSCLAFIQDSSTKKITIGSIFLSTLNKGCIEIKIQERNRIGSMFGQEKSLFT